MITEDEFATEDGRLAKAQEAGRELAVWEQKHGHTTPRANWDKGDTRNAGAFSHLTAAGFTNFGARSYSQVFIDAYRNAFASQEDES